METYPALNTQAATVLLLQYSEWLDVEKIDVSSETPDDSRSHSDLVEEFLASRGDNWQPVLA